LLERLPAPTDPRVLVAHQGHEDAGVYLVHPGLAAVQSIDVFAPVVDDGYDYGRISAANAMSDLWAMGVDPSFALAFLAIPESLEPGVAAEILSGGVDHAALGGCTIIGGHSIRDVEPKYGLAVTGFGDPEALWRNDGARPGDALVLTKPIGSGVLTTAIKRRRLSDEAIAEVVGVMAELNQGACRAGRRVTVHGATDVTGFGLLGHLGEMCRGAGLGFRLEARAVPLLSGVLGLIEDGVVPAGSKRNLAYALGFTRFAEHVSESLRLALADAQTSGGLLLAVPAEEASRLGEELAREGTLAAAVIGRFEEAPAPAIEVG
jgi:selenide,water dikinase